jgi:hypothetical protein
MESAVMTKKTAVVLIAASLFVALALPVPAWAQPRRDRRPIGLYVNLGYMNLNSYPKWVTLGPELEVRLGRAVTVNPELSFWLRDFFGDTVHIVPGGTVNLRLRSFFVGGGAVRRISDWAEEAGGWWVPKLQAGYAGGPVKIGVCLLLLNRTDDFIVGATLGIGL